MTERGTHRSTWITPDEARAALQTGTGRGIKIAILDSGVELSHPALEHLRLLDDLALQAGENNVAVRAPGWGTDGYGHGTAVAARRSRGCSCAPRRRRCSAASACSTTATNARPG